MSDTMVMAEQIAKSSGKPKRARLVWRIVGVILLALVLFAGYKAARAALYANSAYRSAQDLLAALQDGVARERLPVIQTALQHFSDDLSGLEQELSPTAPLLRNLGGLPTYGGTLAALPDLLGAASDLVSLGKDAFVVLAPTLAAAPNPSPMDAGLYALSQVGTELVPLADRAEQVRRKLNLIPASQLHPRIADQFARAQRLAALLPTGFRLAPVLPELLGFNGPKTYLVLVQNNDELRATGGFLTGVGRLTMDQGRPSGLEFSDSYKIYRRESIYPSAPEPLRRYMKIELMVLRDANWSPDLSTTAQVVRALYVQDTGQQIDGIVTADLHLVELLLGALGALQVEGADEPITAENVVEKIKEFYDRPPDSGVSLADDGLDVWWQQRKDFMPALAQAALARLFGEDIDYLKLLEAGVRALDERAAQVWLSDPAAAAVLADLRWDGGLHPEPGADFLAVVDANMGYNKVDAVIDRAMRYQVEWPNGPGQPARARVTLTYTHQLEVPGHVCDNSPRYGKNYADMTERCYFAYTRLYAPAGSRLIEVQGVEPGSVSSQRGERSAQVFSGYFVVEPGEEHEVVFTYDLPASITPDRYKLVLQRQSGTRPLPLSVQVGDQAWETTVTAGYLVWER